MPDQLIPSRPAAPGLIWVVRMLLAARVMYAGAWIAFLAGPFVTAFGWHDFPHSYLGCASLLAILFFWGAVVLLEWEIKQRRLARLENGYCPDCGHDIATTPDRCPRCGRVTSNIAVAITHTGQIPAPQPQDPCPTAQSDQSPSVP